MKKTITPILTIMFLLGVFFAFLANLNRVHAAGNEYYMSGIRYDFEDSGDYELDAQDKNVVGTVKLV